MPAAERATPATRRPGATLGATLGLALLLALALQLWRPFFFLTDDNLGYLPLYAGLSAGVPHDASRVFNGAYRPAADPTMLSYRHPLIEGIAAWAGRYTVEIVATIQLMLAAGLMAALLWVARRRWALDYGDATVVLLSLSYAFCGWAIILGSGWAMYLGNLSALPLIARGLIAQRRWLGWLFVSLGLAHSLLSGHPGTLLWTGFYFTVLALALAWVERDPLPLLSWFIGGAVAVALTTPYWWPAMEGFAASYRSQPVPDFQITSGNEPLAKFLGGYLLVAAFMPERWFDFWMFGVGPIHWLLLSACAVGWATLAAWRPATLPASAVARRVSWVMPGVALLSLLINARPVWLAEIIAHIPLYRSLRWPVKEVIVTLFFLHLWLALRWPVGKVWGARGLVAAGAVLYVAAMLKAGAPSTGVDELDRRYLLSGISEKVWAEIRAAVPPDAVILPSLDVEAHPRVPEVYPTSLVGGRNFAVWLGRQSALGYSPTAPDTWGHRRDMPYYYKAVAPHSDPALDVDTGGRPLYRLVLRPGPAVEILRRTPTGWQAVKTLAVPEL